MSFDQAFARTVGAEGGFSDNAADPGGNTNWGITERVARAHGYQGAMKDMPIAKAKEIYKSGYWDLIHLGEVDKISPLIAIEMFDTAVNCGVTVPVSFVQRALNALNRRGKDYPDHAVDGLFGAVTAESLRQFMVRRGAAGEKVVLALLNSEQGVRYLEIVEKREASEDFLFGWVANRVAV